MPTCRSVEAVVSRKSGHKFPESRGNLLTLNTRHLKIFKTFWVMVSHMVKPIYATVLTRSLDHLQAVWVCWHNRLSLAHTSKEPLDYSRNCWKTWWKICEDIPLILQTDKKITWEDTGPSWFKRSSILEVRSGQFSGFWHKRSRVYGTSWYSQDGEVSFGTKRHTLEITACCRTYNGLKNKDVYDHRNGNQPEDYCSGVSILWPERLAQDWTMWHQTRLDFLSQIWRQY